MSEDEDEYGISKPIDKDYINPEGRRAEVDVDAEHEDNLDRSSRRTDLSHTFDGDSGSAAASKTDEFVDEHAVVSNDGRSNTRTFFYPSEADSDKFEKLYKYQEGQWSADRAVRNREADRSRWVDTFCGRLDMSTHHRERVALILEGIDMSKMSHYSSQQIILSIISLVANEDGWWIRENEQFRQLVEDVGTDMLTIRKVRNRVREVSEDL